MKFSIRVILFLFLLIMTSCSNYVMIQEQKRQKELLSAAIVKDSSRQFTIHVYPVECNSKNPEVFYISKALSEIMANYLKPMMNEVIIIPYDYQTNQEIVNLILDTNSMFSNYLTNMETVSTQFVYDVVSTLITNIIVITNVEETLVQKKKTKVYSYTYITNTNEQNVTNISISGITSTNRNVLTESRYRDLLNTEFPELTNSLTRVPIVVVKNFDTNDDLTNISPETETNFSQIYGSFSAFQNKNGPNDIQLKLTVIKHINKKETLNLSLNSREDRVSDKIYDLLKPIRKFYLDRPTGDVVLVTDPIDANIYIDGTYIGKSPLLYPAVTAESHQFTFLKPGYSQTSLRAEVLEDKTNVIYKIITKLKSGGTVEIDSDPTNANVFIESSYVGNTPLTVTNLTLDMDHRVKILNTDTNFDLPAYYHTFKLHNESDTYKINANLVPNYAFKSFMKETLWWTTMGGWGITLAFIGLNIYTHYQYEYNMDYYLMYKNAGNDSYANAYYNNYLDFYNLNQTSFTGFVISTMVSLGVTAIMLYNNEVYLGLNVDPQQNTTAYISFKY